MPPPGPPLASLCCREKQRHRPKECSHALTPNHAGPVRRVRGLPWGTKDERCCGDGKH